MGFNPRITYAPTPRRVATVESTRSIHAGKDAHAPNSSRGQDARAPRLVA
ncbi:hypothetical protein [Chloracidobacterium thermophilum]|nr:hypothetical protein [Chloracidobacterium thermophilum]QUV78887.1 hypothetical protein J8C08_00950 [Chloracidobacterium thermophilum]